MREQRMRGEIMNNIIECKLESTHKEIFTGLWQHDYGQILRITGADLPKAVEVQFSTKDKGGDTLTRIGTTVDGATEVKVPDSLLKNENCTQNYLIYAWIYVTDDTSGNTEYQIILHVKSRPKPEEPTEEPLPEPNIFHETVEAVNAAADRAKMAEQSAKESATEAGKYAASASESAVTAEKTKEDALRKVGEKKQEAIEAIQNQEETSVGKITTHTDGEIQRIQNQTTESKGELEQTIINAGVSEEELDESVQTASDTKTALDKSVELAGTAKTELDTSIREAGTAKTALDESTETAGTVQETLSATVKQAGALDTSLGENIETGTQLKTDLTASGEKAVQDIQAAGSEQLGKMQAVAEAFTADREQIATNKKDIGSLKEDLGSKITKFYASNQGETHLADSDNGKIMDMMLYGRSEQENTTGANLIDVDSMLNDCFIKNKDETYSILKTEDGRFSKAFPVNIKAGTVVRFDADIIEYNGTYRNKLQITFDGQVMVAGESKVFDVDVAKCSIYQDNSNSIGTYTKFKNAILSIGDIQIPYEPYTGGKPSPSPDYPQEIKSVGDSGSVAVKVMGKNLLPTNCGQNITALRYDAQYNRWAFDALKPVCMVNLRIIDPTTAHYLLSPGTYTITLVSFENVQNVTISAVNADWKTLASVVPGRLSKTFSVDANTIVGCYFVPKDDNATGYLQVQLELGTTATSYEPYTEQFVQLPYTLNAIPVASGGNVTIDGQQYIADRVVEKDGVFGIERNTAIDVPVLTKTLRETPDTKGRFIQDGAFKKTFTPSYAPLVNIGYSRIWGIAGSVIDKWIFGVNKMNLYISPPKDLNYTSEDIFNALKDLDIKVYGALVVPFFEPFPGDIQAKLRTLVTNYPVTNISVTSDQLDGYTVFNYPISMANGWNYVKQQQGDIRDYIYDMDAKTQDIDTQSAEAYVNSEYAVALTELEV